MLAMLSLFSFFNSWWGVFLGLGTTIVLLVGIAVFFGVWPVISGFLTPVVGAIGNFLGSYIEDARDGFNVIVANGHAIIFAASLVVGMHLVDKFWLVPHDTCKAMLDDIHQHYRLVPKPHRSNWPF